MTHPTAIVLLHGWGFRPTVCQGITDALVQNGMDHPILTPELPLIPGSTLETTLAQLAYDLPHESHLIGWSLGGEMALAFALRYPDRVKSLALISATPCFMNQADWPHGQPNTLLDDFDNRLANDAAALLKRFGLLIRHGDPQASKDRALADSLLAHTEPNTSRLASGLNFLRSIDSRSACTQALSCPLLIIHGDSDAVVPIAAAQWLQTALHGNLYTVTAASHALPLTHAAEIGQALRTHIASAS